MLQIRTASGEELVALHLASFLETIPAGMHPVRALKQHLHSMCGLSRFRQRLVFLAQGDNDVLVDEDRSLSPGDVQVVLLSFCPASDMQVEALQDAARDGLTSEVENILQRPQDPDLGDPAPLFQASENGQTEVVRLLLEANADKDKAAQDGETALFIAAREGQLEVARLLLEANADKDKPTEHGFTPLYIAAAKGRLEVVRLLLEASPDKDKATYNGTTSLSIAAVNGHLDVARLLLEASADKDKATQNGSTPLYIAADQGHLEVVRLLLEASADKDKAKKDGTTPLLVATKRGHPEVARMLQES